MKKLVLLPMSFLILSTLNLSCGKKAATPTPTDNSSEEEINQKPSTNYFYVHNKFINGSYRTIHTQGNWGRKCFVDFDDPIATNRDIKCVVESTEFDAAFLGLELNYNIPPFEKCSYLKVTSSYYFKNQAVDLETYADSSKHLHFDIPTTVEYTKNANGFIITSTYKVTLAAPIYGSTPDGGTTATYSATSTPKSYEIAPLNNNHPNCRYDYSLLKGPNCCEGTYTVYASSTSSTGTVTADAPAVQEWGGQLSSCLDGPYKENDKTTIDGWPASIIYRMENQASNGTASVKNSSSNKIQPKYEKLSLNEIKQLSAKDDKFAEMVGFPFNRMSKSNLTSKNVSTLETTTPNNFGSWKVASTLGQKYGTYYYVNWLDGIQAQSPPRAFYDAELLTGVETRSNSWTCYDDAYEMYARIKVYIRMWNTYAELAAATGDPADGVGNDDIAGPETDFPSEQKNDQWDWERIRDDRTQNGKHYPGYYLTDL